MLYATVNITSVTVHIFHDMWQKQNEFSLLSSKGGEFLSWLPSVLWAFFPSSSLISFNISCGVCCWIEQICLKTFRLTNSLLYFLVKGVKFKVISWDLFAISVICSSYCTVVHIATMMVVDWSFPQLPQPFYVIDQLLHMSARQSSAPELLEAVKEPNMELWEN